jgi:hypothetical protein
MQSEPAANDELVSAALNSSSNLCSQAEATREYASVVERFYDFRKWVIDEGALLFALLCDADVFLAR